MHGCVRKEEDYTVPNFKKNNDGKLIYLSFGSLGSGDIDLMKRLIETLGDSKYRVLVNVGDYKSEYESIPDNKKYIIICISICHNKEDADVPITTKPEYLRIFLIKVLFLVILILFKYFL